MTAGREDDAPDVDGRDDAWCSAAPAMLSAGAVVTGDGGAHPFEEGQATRYQSVTTLGEGGMGRVRLVLDRRLKRQVALKEPRLGADSRRLSQEAWITAQLEHPGIVSVYDAGVSSEGLYYTMRLVRGRSLEEALALTPGAGGIGERIKLVRHFLAACEAVAFAHRSGIVHRDIKPQNIMVGEFGETVVVDWGLARPTTSDASDWERSVLSPGLAAETLVGEIVGTPAYMSPEQAWSRGRVTDARSDVWSLGATLYRLLVGEPPWSASDGEVIEHVRRGVVPSLEARAPSAPRELVAIANRALAKEASERYADARELAADVAAWLDGRRVSAHPYSPIELLKRVVKAWRVPLAVAALGLVALAIVGIVAANGIVVERDRAVVAESSARDALSTSDQNLALALLGRAEGEAQRPEIELFAAHALKLADGSSASRAPWVAASARGWLMHLEGPRPRVVEERALPSCAPRVVSGDVGQTVCLGETTSMWRGGDRVWSVSLGSRDAVFVRDRVVVMTLEQELVAFDMAGRERGRAVLEQPGRLAVVGERVLVIYGWGYEEVVVLDDELGHRGLVLRCPERRTLEAVAGRERVSVVCDDGTVRADEVWSTAITGRAVALSSDEARLAILAANGRLAVVEVATGVSRVVDTGLVSGARVAWLGDALVALGVGQGARVLADGVRVVLPRFDADDVRVVDGGLWTLGAARARRWSLEVGPAPVIGALGDPGIATLARRGERVVIGRGDGRVESWRAGTREAVYEAGDRVAKRVALSRDGERVYVSTIDREVAILDARTLASRGRLAVDSARRIEVLADDSLLVCAFARDASRHLPSGERVALDGAFVCVDSDVDASGERAVLLEDGGHRVGILEGGALSLVGRRPGDARAVAIDDVVAILTTNEVVLMSRDGVEVGRFTSLGGTDVELAPGVVIVAAMDRVTRVHARDGRVLAVLGGHGERVAQVVVDEDAIWSASWDGTARRYALAPLMASGEALAGERERAWGLELARLLGD